MTKWREIKTEVKTAFKSNPMRTCWRLAVLPLAFVTSVVCFVLLATMQTLFFLGIDRYTLREIWEDTKPR